MKFLRASTGRLLHAPTVLACVAVAMLSANAPSAWGVAYWTPDYDLIQDGSNSTPVVLPADLVRPESSFIDSGTGLSGLMISPNWMITAKHNLLNNRITQTIGGQQYRSFLPDLSDSPEVGDIALAEFRYSLADGATGPVPNLPYIPLATNSLLSEPGVRFTTIGYGRTGRFSTTSGKLATNGGQGKLRFGHNVIDQRATIALDENLASTFGLFAEFDNPTDTDADYVPYEGHGLVGDSGSGWYVRDGWDWKLVGITSVGGIQSDGTASGYGSVDIRQSRDWIDSHIPGGAPSFTGTAKPTASHAWSGTATSNWSDIGNWAGGVLPQFNVTAADTVDITGSSDLAIVNTAGAQAQDIFIGATGAAPQLRLVDGGELRADAIFLGPEADTPGELEIFGGTLNVDSTYVGHYGAGNAVHSGGTVNSRRLIIGKDNAGQTSAATPTYELQAAALAGDAPLLESKLIALGAEVGSGGQLSITGSPSEFATLNADRVIVGHRGSGTLTQQTGTASAKLLRIGTDAEGIAPAGVGLVELNGGTFNGGDTTIAASSRLVVQGGDYSADYLRVQGTLEATSGSVDPVAFRVEDGGSIDFGNTAMSIDAPGITNLSGATLLNVNGTPTLDIPDDSLLVINTAIRQQIIDGDIVVRQNGAVVTDTTARPFHFAGNTIVIGTGERIAGAGDLLDPVVVTNGGLLETVDGPITITGALVKDGSSTVSLNNTTDDDESAAVLFATAGAPASLVSATPTGGFSAWAAGVQAGGTLTLGGTPTFTTAQDNAGIISNGRLEIGHTGPTDIATLSPRTSDDERATLVVRGEEAVIAFDITPAEHDTAEVFIGVLRDDAKVEVRASHNDLPSFNDGQIFTLIDAEDFVSGRPSKLVYGSSTLSEFLAGADGLSNPLGGRALALVHDDQFGSGKPYAGTQFDCTGLCAVIAYPGDFNLDGDVDQVDLDLFNDNVGDLDSGATWAEGDVDGDGDVDTDDLAIWQPYFGKVRNGYGIASTSGDYNGDGVVDAADYTVWRLAQTVNNRVADGNGDGIVDDADFRLMRSNFGLTVVVAEPQAAAAQAVPEPGTLLLALLATLAILPRRPKNAA